MLGNEGDRSDAQRIERAVELIRLGARLQLAESAAGLSEERLLALFQEAQGEAAGAAVPSVPAEWFLHWQPNVHASLFVSIWRYLESFADLHGLDAVAQAYRIYLTHVQATNVDPILTVARAWTLVRYLEVLLTTAPCTGCGSHFIADIRPGSESASLCGLCRPTNHGIT